ncbi:PREDICTED: polypyrimidine tract-binding protein 3-like [Merops nubicus]|uniref:polypyrimidine tract-binding protein 3-like n=1 Tax=Merops nubicus TaxID=57421 RepID=UPI0004F0B971|nr:PREDICTED: polypyrimidine tract-binding protein 3-like [Merops nubicus]
MSNSTPHEDDGNGEEKLKAGKTPCTPSRVLHLRQIPSDVTEAEIIALGLPFGKVTNLLMLKDKNQALLEMASTEAAVAVVNYYAPVFHLHSQPVYIQYSNYKELETDKCPDQARVQAALHAVNAMQCGSLPTASASCEGAALPGHSSVLRVAFENVLCSVDLEMLHQIFARFGSVLKIVTFTKKNRLQALIQYAHPMYAQEAKRALNGQNIYAACCSLRIDFSHLRSLQVKYNGHKSRDFTRTNSPYGDGRIPLQPPTGPFSDTSVPPVHRSPTSAASGHMTVPSATDVLPHCVVLVNNLNTEFVTPQKLFILFGVYGNVQRVKIMFRKRENALIQMADTMQAKLAISHLDGQMLYGRVLHVTLSKCQTVYLCEGQDDCGLTQDYRNSLLHRFKKANSKNVQNIYPPSATLHISNIPLSATADCVKTIFANKGFTVKAFKFFEKDGRMALIQLGSVEEAVHALIEIHHYDFGSKHHLRVSFSKYKI